MFSLYADSVLLAGLPRLTTPRQVTNRLLRISSGFLWDYRNAVDQKLRARDDDFVTGLHAVQHHVVVSDDLADLERLLVDNISTFLVGLGNECEIESADARDRNHRDNRFLIGSPNNASANELGRAQGVVGIGDLGLSQSETKKVYRDNANSFYKLGL